MLRSHRPLIIGRHGAVASNHPMATLAGLDVLRAGGNAVDATIAVAFTIGVVEPHMSGIGGDGFYHLYDAPKNSRLVINASGAAPLASTAEAFVDGIPDSGPRSVSTPGMVGGLAALHAGRGRLPWSDLVSFAISAARDGFGVTRNYQTYAAQQANRLRAHPAAAATYLGLDGMTPSIGHIIRQPRLAATLEAIATDGAEIFYRGTIAHQIAAAVAGQGGYLAERDFQAFRPEKQDPIRISYRDFEIFQTPPNTTGFVLLQMLKLLERVDVASHERLSDILIHLMVEAKKIAFEDRERFGCDPLTQLAPLDRLLSPEYADQSKEKIDPDHAARSTLGGVSEDTTYFCVVDDKGSAVSAIQSINSAFGSGFVAGETGVLLNNRMTYWHLSPGHPNKLVPGRRVRHTMNAPMVFRDGRLWAVLGTPGGDNQVQVNLQVLTAMIDFGLDPQQAVEAPRWSSRQPGQDANYPHLGEESLTMEAGFPSETYMGLARRGHILEHLPALEGPCSVSVIRVDEASGSRIAGSDPRRDGWALAY